MAAEPLCHGPGLTGLSSEPGLNGRAHGPGLTGRTHGPRLDEIMCLVKSLSLSHGFLAPQTRDLLSHSLRRLAPEVRQDASLAGFSKIALQRCRK